MTFKLFTTIIKTEMSERFPDREIIIKPIEKLQGQSYTALIAKVDNTSAAPAINLNRFYEQLQAGRDLGTILNDIAEVIINAIDSTPILPESFTDYEYVKQHISLQLVPIEGNEARLAELPHQQFCDLAVCYRVMLSTEGDRVASFSISNKYLEQLGVAQEQLYADALEQVSANSPARLRNLAGVIRDIWRGHHLDIKDGPLWVADTTGSVNGAAVILYPGFLAEAAEKIGGNLYVLPSSVHEVLLIAERDAESPQELLETVTAVNASEVRPEDRLSDSIYYYDKTSGDFSRVNI